MKQIKDFPQQVDVNSEDKLLIQTADGIYKYITVGDLLAQSGSGTSAKTYPEEVLADFPWSYLRLGEKSGETLALDSSGNKRNGAYNGSIVYGVAGGLKNDSNTAITLNGASYLSFNTSAISAPQTFALECLFKTSSADGSLFGFSNAQGTGGSAFDRELYLSSGRLVFRVYTSGELIISSPNTYNDNLWHIVTATLSTSGMQLWIDGSVVASTPNNSAANYSGYWHIGYSTFKGYFLGAIDECSINIGNIPDFNRIYARHLSARA